jgi:thiamine pyrophosphate-dependent acetolactate synthase large subunit-like protein
MSRMSGAQFIAENLKGYGVTHIFYVEAILRRTLVETERPGVKRILTHSEKKAEHPVLVAGRGAILSSTAPEIDKISQLLSIPVVASPGGKGIIADDSDLSAGVVGAYGRSCASQVVSEADLIVYVGSGVGDHVTHDWTIPPLKEAKAVNSPSLIDVVTNQECHPPD